MDQDYQILGTCIEALNSMLTGHVQYSSDIQEEIQDALEAIETARDKMEAEAEESGAEY